MKKILVIMTLLLFGTVFFAVAESGRESKQLPPQEVEIMYSSEDHAYQVKDINDVVRWKVLPDGSMAGYNTSGTTVWHVTSSGGMITSKVDAVVLNDPDQFSTWSGQAATSGQSYYQLEAGKRYIVDVWGIATNGYAQAATTAYGTDAAFSGVSLILPDASTYSESTVIIELATTGATGWPAWNGSAAGTTTVFVYPYSGGSTSYNANTTIAQTLANVVQLTSAAGQSVWMIPRNMAAGASLWMLDKPGESVEYALYNSQVSAYPKAWNFLN